MTLPTPYKVTFIKIMVFIHQTNVYDGMPYNGELTEEEYNNCYMEITGTDDNDCALTSSDVSSFTVKYADCSVENIKNLLQNRNK